MIFLLIGMLIGIFFGGLIAPMFYAAMELRWKRQYVALEDAYWQLVEDLAGDNIETLETFIGHAIDRYPRSDHRHD